MFPNYLGGISAIQTTTILNTKTNKQVKMPLWFICLLMFELGICIGLLLFL